MDGSRHTMQSYFIESTERARSPPSATPPLPSPHPPGKGTEPFAYPLPCSGSQAVFDLQSSDNELQTECIHCQSNFTNRAVQAFTCDAMQGSAETL